MYVCSISSITSVISNKYFIHGGLCICSDAYYAYLNQDTSGGQIYVHVSGSTSIRSVVNISGSMGYLNDGPRGGWGEKIVGPKGVIKKSYAGPPAPISSCVDAMSFVLDQFSHDNDHVAITLFDSKVYNEMSWTKKAGNEHKIEKSIRKCERTGGHTALCDAVNSALDSPPPEHAGPYWVFLLTDGATAGPKQNSRSCPRRSRRQTRLTHSVA